MNLMELFVKIGVDDQATSKITTISEKIGTGLQTAANIGIAAVGVASAAVVALTKSSVESYSEYEQLVGGVETLFKKSSDTVMKYASDAYKTAGLSANDYMDTVTSFSASLLQSTGRGAQTNLTELEAVLDAEYIAAKRAYEDEYDALRQSWKERIALAKEGNGENAELLQQQRDEELKALKRSNEDALSALKIANEEKLAEAERINNSSTTTAESQQRAADLANQAIVDMADNANKMGTSIEMIQNAYQGFAKQNYTMLDNLKLGYGGTQEEMKRLVADANAVKEANGEMGDLSISSFADIVEAIHIVQTEMGITGTTAKEASSTISGSVASAKAAWENLVTGMADENADMDTLISNFVESVGVVGENIFPRIEIALSGATRLVDKLFPVIVKKIPNIISDNLPRLTESGLKIVESLVSGIGENRESITTTALDVIMTLSQGVLSMSPDIIALGLDLLVALATGISSNLPTLTPTIISVMMQIISTLTAPDTLATLGSSALDIILALADGVVKFLPQLVPATINTILFLAEMLTDPETLSELLNAALVILTELGNGLMDAIPALVDAALTIIENLTVFLLDPENISLLIGAALEIVLAIGTGIIDAIPRLLESVATLVDSAAERFVETDWGEVGKNIVDGVLEGLKKAWKSLTKWFDESWEDLVGGVEDLLGIASPSKVFKRIGGFTAEGFGIGFEDEFDKVIDGIDKSLSFDDYDASINASVNHYGTTRSGAIGGSSISGVTIHIHVGGTTSTAEEIAEEVSAALQNLTNRRAAVYG